MEVRSKSLIDKEKELEYKIDTLRGMMDAHQLHSVLE